MTSLDLGKLNNTSAGSLADRLRWASIAPPLAVFTTLFADNYREWRVMDRCVYDFSRLAVHFDAAGTRVIAQPRFTTLIG